MGLLLHCTAVPCQSKCQRRSRARCLHADYFSEMPCCLWLRRLFAQPTAIWEDTSLCAWRDGPRRRGSNAADHTLRRLEWLSPRSVHGHRHLISVL